MRWLIQLFGRSLMPQAQRFHAALEAPQVAQKIVQQIIFNRLLASQYGQSLNVHSIHDWHQIPIVEYDDLLDLILPPSSWSPLTPDPIKFYEKTSGSRGSVKWIPYTNALRRSFNQMFCIWAQDLIQHGARFSTGKFYFCISPQLALTAPASTQLQNDSEYLDLWLQWFLRPFLVGSQLSQLRDPETFKHQLCLALLRAEQLEIISIWSPSFLQVHLDYIQLNQRKIQQELQHQISYDRWQLLNETQIPWAKVWSNLKLISCWDSVHAADPANGLRAQFPNVLVQGKGLLATEAPMTIPLIKAQGCVPILDEVLFEFEATDGKVYWLHELEVGQSYTIILSQKGGLYRYRIGDRVRVTHFYCQTPCLEFLGRTTQISDLVGEKLHEEFIRKTLAELLLDDSYFKSLVPVLKPKPYYLLLLDRATLASSQLALKLDQLLCRSPHYQQARQLGQLAPVDIIIAPDIAAQLAQHRTRSGCVWGDVKHSVFATIPLDAGFVAELKRSVQSL